MKRIKSKYQVIRELNEVKAEVLNEDKLDLESYKDVLEKEVKKVQEHVNNNEAVESDLIHNSE